MYFLDRIRNGRGDFLCRRAILCWREEGWELQKRIGRRIHTQLFYLMAEYASLEQELRTDCSAWSAGCDQPTLKVELHDTVRTRRKHTWPLNNRETCSPFVVIIVIIVLVGETWNYKVLAWELFTVNWWVHIANWERCRSMGNVLGHKGQCSAVFVQIFIRYHQASSFSSFTKCRLRILAWTFLC